MAPTQSKPYPYEFTASDPLLLQPLPHLLIIGDQAGARLQDFAKEFIAELSQGLGENLKIKNLSTPREGLHRTLAKVKSIKQLPPIIVYFAGPDLLAEPLLAKGQVQNVLFNLRLYQDDRLKTLLDLFPEISKFVFRPIRPILLDLKSKEIPLANTEEFPPALVQINKEISYLLYEIQLDELIRYIKSKNKKLIIVSSPLNLETVPKRVCENSTSEFIMNEQNAIFKLMQAGDFKMAYDAATELEKAMPGNALTVYLLGNILINLGQKEKGIEYYEKASALDCGLWRGDAVHLAILAKMAVKYDIFFFDYHALINESLGQNILFFDDIRPQSIFDQEMVRMLIPQIKKYLKL